MQPSSTGNRLPARSSAPAARLSPGFWKFAPPSVTIVFIADGPGRNDPAFTTAVIRGVSVRSQVCAPAHTAPASASHTQRFIDKIVARASCRLWLDCGEQRLPSGHAVYSRIQSNVTRRVARHIRYRDVQLAETYRAGSHERLRLGHRRPECYLERRCQCPQSADYLPRRTGGRGGPASHRENRDHIPGPRRTERQPLDQIGAPHECREILVLRDHVLLAADVERRRS